MTVVAVAAALALMGLVALLAYGVRSSDTAGPDDEAFARAASGEDALSKFFVDAARPLRRLPLVNDNSSPLYQFVQARLLAAGGAYNGEVEVFLAAQTAAVVLGAAVLLLTASGVVNALAGTNGMVGVALGCVLAVGVAVLPYERVDRRAKQRAREIGSGLPEFAELLQMPLTSGLSVIKAMEFTSRNTSGLVADEVANVVWLINTRALGDDEAFELAGERLATPEAKAFFNALRQAHVDGSRVVETIGRQAETLRSAQFQRQREELKRVPVRLIVVFAVFLLPPVIVLVLFNFAAAFTKV